MGRYETGCYGVQVVGKYAFVAGNAGLQLIDVSKPASPVRVGGYDTSQSFAVHVVGNSAYVAGGKAGLQVIDVRGSVKAAAGRRI